MQRHVMSKRGNEHRIAQNDATRLKKSRREACAPGGQFLYAPVLAG